MTLVYGEGWSGLRVGDGSVDLVTALGEPDTIEDIGDSQFYYYASKGLYLNVDPYLDRIVAFYFFDGGTDTPEGFSAFGYMTTDAGISWSTDVDDVLDVYGVPVHDFSGVDGGVAWRRLSYPGMSFRFEDGNLRTISIPGG